MSESGQDTMPNPQYQPVSGPVLPLGEMYGGASSRQSGSQVDQENAPILQTPRYEPQRINGGYAPGFTGNPGGIPSPATISEALKTRMNNGAAVKLADELIRLGTEAESEQVRVNAINAAADRVEGKPTQTINQRGVFIISMPAGDDPFAPQLLIDDTSDQTPALPPAPAPSPAPDQSTK